MATFSTDFSEYSTGSPPSDWTDRWNTSWTTDVITGAMSTNVGGKNLELDPSADARKLLSWDDVDADANRDDFEILTRFECSTYSSAHYLGFTFGRASGASGSETAYYTYLRSGRLYLSRYDAGAATSLGDVLLTNLGLDGADLDDLAFWVRFRGNGSSLKVKIWSVKEPEPGGWHLEETDSTITAAGWVGVGRYEDTQTDYIDYFAVGTDGDSPTLPAVTTDNVQLNAMHAEVAISSPAAAQLNLNALHTEVAYTSPTEGELHLNGMHLEVAYSIPPTELHVTHARMQVLSNHNEVTTVWVTQARTQVLSNHNEPTEPWLTQLRAQVLCADTGLGGIESMPLICINS